MKDKIVENKIMETLKPYIDAISSYISDEGKLDVCRDMAKEILQAIPSERYKKSASKYLNKYLKLKVENGELKKQQGKVIAEGKIVKDDNYEIWVEKSDIDGIHLKKEFNKLEGKKVQIILREVTE